MHVVIGRDLVQGLGRRRRRVIAEIFCRPLENVKFRGTVGTRCLGEFQCLNHGFRVGLYIGLVDFVDFNI